MAAKDTPDKNAVHVKKQVVPVVHLAVDLDKLLPFSRRGNWTSTTSAQIQCGEMFLSGIRSNQQFLCKVGQLILQHREDFDGFFVGDVSTECHRSPTDLALQPAPATFTFFFSPLQFVTVLYR